ncbi:antA/AntB antirepressor family protein [Rosenbergiella nectarea]|uniref:antA/AntB antirepressor family protein n=1 Tax=Rosenbergiella nectarea TaxID=988801 RepID=UPI001BD9D3B6|nr:antA/AntB antirepressor family protein [Rosenbergiella nectarea]MBT0729642.1 antA/AntB antirepressor family protein [Rosenbergiella nectarea subsp. apis]
MKKSELSFKVSPRPEHVAGVFRPETNNEPQSVFADLIPVISGQVGGRDSNIVSAKALHKTLGVGRDFTNWIKGRIAQYGFTLGDDYTLVESLSTPTPMSAKSRQQLEHDYLITTNMAKELAMVERTEQGRAVRKYFIQCEEELSRTAPAIAANYRQHLKARLKAASNFKPMCEALDLSRAEHGKATLPRHYSNESNMITRIALGGLTANQWALANGLPKEKARDYMTTDQLEHLAYLESTNITLIDMGMDYYGRKAELLRLSQRWLSKP